MLVDDVFQSMSTKKILADISKKIVLFDADQKTLADVDWKTYLTLTKK